MDCTTLPDLAVLPEWLQGARQGPLDLLATCLAQIAELDGELNAVVALDSDNAERAAAASADRWRRAAPLSRIDGAPLLVKANYAVAGLPWHGGIAAYADRVADFDAPIVARLRRAGAVILGLTNLDEGALGATGDNPWLGRIGNPRRADISAGGSSGGSAAAVAAGLCIGALGTDTIGSIALPAAYCGVVGHRASRELAPVDSVIPLAPSFDHGGWHTSSVRGARALCEALGAPSSPSGPYRIAVLDGHGDTPEAIEQARAAGWTIEPVAAPTAFGDIARRMFEVAEAEAAVEHALMRVDRPDGFSPAFGRMLDWGAGKGRARREDNLVALALAAEAVRAQLAGYDALLMPAMPHQPHAAGSPPPANQSTYAALPACLGWPATTIPERDNPGRAVLVTALSDATCLSIADRL